ncbi:hypothetical protein [Rubrivirga sp. IMCC43871]|uniref:hypothetical protein n=1 Tax=Rubrivirga sp. IMCC43871 TaxID=3391575 RepID=UPI00399007E9
MADRTYSEREVADLIGRAVERQQEAATPHAEVGLTLAEVERIGRETGIDPTHLRAAAAEMDAAGRTLSRQSGHTNTHVTVERWVDASLTPEGWEDIVARLEAEIGLDTALTHPGTVQQVGNAYEWSHTSGLGIRTTVTASPRDGRTRLRLRQLVGSAGVRTEGVIYGLAIAVVAAFIATAAASGAVGFATFALVWALAAPATMVLDRRWRDKKLRDLDALADGLAPLVSGPSHVAEPPAPARPLLDLDDLDPEPPDAEGSGSASRRARS